jgi:hypothetical protein
MRARYCHTCQASVIATEHWHPYISARSRCSPVLSISSAYHVISQSGTWFFKRTLTIVSTVIVLQESRETQNSSSSGSDNSSSSSEDANSKGSSNNSDQGEGRNSADSQQGESGAAATKDVSPRESVLPLQDVAFTVHVVSLV